MLRSMQIELLSRAEALPFIHANHYSRGSHANPRCYGARVDGNLVAVAAFATPCSEAVRSQFFGPSEKDAVTELHRLVAVQWPSRPANFLSQFLVAVLKRLKSDRPEKRIVVSFADPTEGHTGAIYKATNWLLVGTTSPTWFYRDPDGRLRHPRQNGRNVSKQEALSLGWVPERRKGKLKYIYILGNRREQHQTRACIQSTTSPPHRGGVVGDVLRGTGAGPDCR